MLWGRREGGGDFTQLSETADGKDPMHALQARSIEFRIAIGSQAGCKDTSSSAGPSTLLTDGRGHRGNLRTEFDSIYVIAPPAALLLHLRAAATRFD